MIKKKFGFIRVIVIVLILIVLVFAAVAGICYYLAVQDNISDMYTLSERDEEIALTAIKGSAFGKEFDIDEIQINTFINDKFCKEKTGNNSGVDHVRFYFYDDRPCEIFAHAFYHSTEFSIHCKVDFDVDETTSEVLLKVYDAYIGELKVPDNVLDMVLEKVLESSERVRYINSGGRNVAFTAVYTIDIANTSGITLGLKEAVPGNAVLKCRTNSLSGQALKAAIEYIASEEGRETITGLIGDVKDKIGGWLNKDDE